MRITRYILFPAIAFALLLSSGCKNTERTEEITADITAAQIEGRRAASYIISHEWQDTAQLQRALLDAKVQQSRYLINNQPKCATAFDSSFVSTIKIIDPALAAKLKGN